MNQARWRASHQVCPRHDNCRRQDSFKVLFLISFHRYTSWTRSISGPFCILVGSSPSFGTVQIAALLDMPRVCRDDAVGHTQKTLGDDFRDLKGIEVLPLHLS